MVGKYIPLDPLFVRQWHLLNTGQDIFDTPQVVGAYRNDINVTGVWSDYTGAGVIVGVFDDGFALHPDFLDNYLAHKAYDFGRDRTGQTAGSHGTATLGLIAAAENGIGGVGVAFGAKAVGYTWGVSVLVDFDRVVSRMLVDNVAVSSHSWKPIVPSFDAVEQERYSAGLVNLAQLGRDGLGTITVFAASNDRLDNLNANFFPTANSIFAITVAAANVDGTVSSYSTPGPSVLVAAPGSGNGMSGGASDLPSIVTTDQLGRAGYNTLKDGDYTDTLVRTIDPATEAPVASGFNGTSAATPIVSGVVALMLEANPELGYRDVQEILAYSAKTPKGVTIWNTNGATDWNGGGLLHNDDLGFGHVDALAAVRLAETWHKQSTYANIATEEVIFSEVDTVVAAGESRNFFVQPQSAIRVQHAFVSVILDMGDVSLNDISMVLTGPDGQTKSVFLDPDKYIPKWVDPDTQAPMEGLPNKITYEFDTVNHWGEISTSGGWTLSIINRSTEQDLTMSAGLSLSGDVAMSGRTFIYTDDYARLGVEDVNRAILADASIGPHSINAAAVTFDTVIDLSRYTATIAGVETAISTSLQFESLITGDGDDILIGDARDTTFLAGRGVNTVEGGAGEDTFRVLNSLVDYVQAGYGDATVLFGGASRDTLSRIDIISFADGSLTLGHDPLVNEVYYATQNPDLFAAGADADTHYAAIGRREGRNPNPWFDTDAYLANHADVKAAGANPLVHYSQIGWSLGDDPSAWFDSSLYLHFNPDVATAGIDPLTHYLKYGLVEGRRISPVADGGNLQEAFDSTFYKLANGDVAAAGVDGLRHYDEYGWQEGRNPNAYFDTAFYLASNPDVAAAGINPLDHYEQHGWREGRDPSTRFDTTAYLDAYRDVMAAGIDPLIHYLQFGIAEERASFSWDVA